MKVVNKRSIYTFCMMFLPFVLLLGQTSLVAVENAETFRVLSSTDRE